MKKEKGKKEKEKKKLKLKTRALRQAMRPHKSNSQRLLK